MPEISNKLGGLVVAVVFIFFGLSLTPTVSDFVYSLNTTTLALQTGGAGAVAILGFLPFIYVAAIVVGGMAILWRLTSD